jgi:hypothetical protein
MAVKDPEEIKKLLYVGFEYVPREQTGLLARARVGKNIV